MGTSKRAWTRVAAMVLLAALMLPAVSTVAQVYDPTSEIPPPTGVEKALTKLGRGLSNVVLGWTEVPLFFDRKVKEGKSFSYLVGMVPVMGTARAVIRTSTGVFEMVTFPFSDRDVNYEAILEPEFIF